MKNATEKKSAAKKGKVRKHAYTLTLKGEEKGRFGELMMCLCCLSPTLC